MKNFDISNIKNERLPCRKSNLGTL
jgi:hypothetical protein